MYAPNVCVRETRPWAKGEQGRELNSAKHVQGREV